MVQDCSSSLRILNFIFKMGSSSDDESHEKQVDEIEEMSVGSDAELLENDTKISFWNHKESIKKRRSYDPQFAAPTYEEKQMMRNADMDIEVSMLEVEVGELVCSLCMEAVSHPDSRLPSLSKRFQSPTNVNGK